MVCFWLLEGQGEEKGNRLYEKIKYELYCTDCAEGINIKQRKTLQKTFELFAPMVKYFGKRSSMQLVLLERPTQMVGSCSLLSHDSMSLFLEEGVVGLLSLCNMPLSDAFPRLFI